MIHLDTHVVAWLYAGTVERFPKAVRRRIEKSDLAVSPAVLLELEYLHEVGRTTRPAREVMDELRERIGLQLAEASFAEVVSAALGLTWTRDPFDRLIAGQAITERAPLLTADRTMRRRLKLAVWN